MAIVLIARRGEWQSGVTMTAEASPPLAHFGGAGVQAGRRRIAAKKVPRACM